MSIIGVDGKFDTYTEKVLGDNTHDGYVVMEITMRSQGPPLHVHPAHEEAFYVIEGECEFEMDGKTLRATPGTFILVPRGAAHKFRLVSPEPAKLLKTLSPPGFEKFSGTREATKSYMTSTTPALRASARVSGSGI